MKVLVVSLYFHPDHTGIANYANSFAASAQQQGHEVQVVTGFSFYPNWKKRKEDRFRFYRTDEFNAIRILRSFIYVPKKPNTIKRILQELSFLFFATFGLVRVKKPDLIVCFTTPILLGFWSSLVSKLFGSKLIINVQDFQLEAALSLGMTKKSKVTQVLEHVEKSSYKKANYVSSITQSMCDILTTRKEVASEKVLLWPNWINIGDYDLSHVNKGGFRKKYNIGNDSRVVCYAGNVGLKQGLEVMVDMAEKARDEPNIQFFIIGSGAALTVLQTLVQEKGLGNIRFLPLLSSQEYLQFLKDIDLFVLPQKKTEFDVYFPSKLMGIMACRVPLLLLADKHSELYKTVESRDIGTCFEIEHVEKASGFVLGFSHEDPDIRRKVENGVEFAKEFDEKKVISGILELTINNN